MMKTKYKFIHFGLSQAGERIWECRNSKTKVLLGWVGWHGLWHKHVFYTESAYCIFDESCLFDIADFVRQLDARQRSGIVPGNISRGVINDRPMTPRPAHAPKGQRPLSVQDAQAEDAK